MNDITKRTNNTNRINKQSPVSNLIRLDIIHGHELLNVFRKTKYNYMN
jgi:hypothetical protein